MPSPPLPSSNSLDGICPPVLDTTSTDAPRDGAGERGLKFPCGAWVAARPGPGALVHTTPDSCCAVLGRIVNLDELMERLTVAEGVAWADLTAAVCAGAVDALAPQILLHCLQATPLDGLLGLLTELQGSFALVAYDGARRAVLSARSADGAHPLWMADGEAAGAGFCSDPAAADASGWRGGLWRELPPGHYVAGAPKARAHLYALTPAALAERGRASDDGGDAPRSPRAVVAPPKPARAAKLAGKLLLLRRADDDGAAGGRLSVSL